MNKKILLIVASIVIIYLVYLYYHGTESFDETITSTDQLGNPNQVIGSKTTPSDEPLMGGDSVVVPILNKTEIGEPSKNEIGLSRKDIQVELDKQCQDFYGNGSTAKENTMNEIGCHCQNITPDIKSERFCGLMPLDQQLHAMRMMAYSNDYDQVE